jgi:hypothetical protein
MNSHRLATLFVSLSLAACGSNALPTGNHPPLGKADNPNAGKVCADAPAQFLLSCGDGLACVSDGNGSGVSHCVTIDPGGPIQLVDAGVQCSGALPQLCELCANGSSGCAHFDANCKIVFCDDDCNSDADCPPNPGASCASPLCSDGSNPCANACVNHQCVARGCPASTPDLGFCQGGTAGVPSARGGCCSEWISCQAGLTCHAVGPVYPGSLGVCE